MPENPIQKKNRLERNKEILKLYWEEGLTAQQVSDLSEEKFGKKISRGMVNQIIKDNPRPDGF